MIRSCAMIAAALAMSAGLWLAAPAPQVPAHGAHTTHPLQLPPGSLVQWPSKECPAGFRHRADLSIHAGSYGVASCRGGYCATLTHRHNIICERLKEPPAR